MYGGNSKLKVVNYTTTRMLIQDTVLVNPFFEFPKHSSLSIREGANVLRRSNLPAGEDRCARQQTEKKKHKKRKEEKTDTINHDAGAGGMGVMASNSYLRLSPSSVMRNLCSRNRRAFILA